VFYRISAVTSQAYLRSLRQTEDMSHRTCNHYREAIVSFYNWCVATGRLLQDPLKALEKLNEETDVRHPRRALTPDDVSRMSG